MSASFDRTLRALQKDGMRPTTLGLIAMTALIAIWSCWMILGRVSVYEVSAAARLETEHVYPVAAAVGGRIVSSNLALGRHVRAGDVLLEIAADREELERTEERTRLAAIRNQIAAIEMEIGAEEHALTEAKRAADAALSEMSQKLSAALASLRSAEDQEARVRKLGEHGLVSELEIVRTTADAESRRADVEAARLAVERLGAQQNATDHEQQSHVGALRREHAALRGELATSGAIVMRHEQEAEERRIVAPVDGRLGEVAPLEIGAFIREGDRITSIVPDTDVRVIAEFLPTGMGRVRGGQPARLRLDAFPWMQYGHVPATVRTVASELRDGRIRVELDLHRPESVPIALEHGLPGAVEVEIERIAPAALVLRTLGYALTRGDGGAGREAPAAREQTAERASR